MEKELKQWHELHKFYCGADYQTKDLAQYLKISPRTIQRWLKGATHPDQDILKLIKSYLAEKATQAALENEG